MSTRFRHSVAFTLNIRRPHSGAFYPQSAIPVNKFNYYTTNFSNNSIFIYSFAIFDITGDPVYASHSYDNIQLDTPLSTHSPVAYIGEVLPFSFNLCSFVNYMGIVEPEEPKLIHTNLLNGITNDKLIPIYNNNSCCMWLENTDYVLMRIETENKPNGTISNNFYHNLIYYDSVENYNDQQTESNYYFAKLFYNDLLNGSITIDSGYKLFYDFYLDKLNNLIISFYDSRGNLINGKYDNNFSIQIIELQTTLNNTLLDSRTGNITDTGNNYNLF